MVTNSSGDTLSSVLDVGVPCIMSLCITSKRMSPGYLSDSRVSLQDTAEKTIVESLGEQAKSIVSRFCCGGTLNFVEEVKLLFEKKSDGAGDGWSCVTFPVSEQTSLKQQLPMQLMEMKQFVELSTRLHAS